MGKGESVVAVVMEKWRFFFSVVCYVGIANGCGLIGADRLMRWAHNEKQKKKRKKERKGNTREQVVHTASTVMRRSRQAETPPLYHWRGSTARFVSESTGH
jgi:hypothetical protein